MLFRVIHKTRFNDSRSCKQSQRSIYVSPRILLPFGPRIRNILRSFRNMWNLLFCVQLPRRWSFQVRTYRVISIHFAANFLPMFPFLPRRSRSVFVICRQARNKTKWSRIWRVIVTAINRMIKTQSKHSSSFRSLASYPFSLFHSGSKEQMACER